MMDLKGKQKRFLRSKANHMRPIFSVGKNGLDQTWLDEVENAVDNRELIKINIQQTADVDVKDVKQFIEENSDIQIVQTIGKTLLLFKESSKENSRKLSVEVSDL